MNATVARGYKISTSERVVWNRYRDGKTHRGLDVGGIRDLELHAGAQGARLCIIWYSILLRHLQMRRLSHEVIECTIVCSGLPQHAVLA